MTKKSIKSLIAGLCVAALTTTGALAAVKKKVPVARHASSTKTAGKTSGKSRKAIVASRRSSSKSSKKVVAQTWRNRQSSPSSERYKEIQQALVDKGFLKSTPNGIWDSQSSDALKQFQTEQKLSPTGKINSSSLISLGLGPKHNSSAPSTTQAPPSATPDPSITR